MQARREIVAPALYTDLIGMPWVLHGRGEDGLDCVGLLLEMMRRLGAALPRYPSDAGVLSIAKSSWLQLRSPEPGCAILLHSSRIWHLGVAVSPETMIHAKEGVGVVVERFTSPLYAKRIEGFYRWQPAASAQ